jgi:hypothetical protein
MTERERPRNERQPASRYKVRLFTGIAEHASAKVFETDWEAHRFGNDWAMTCCALDGIGPDEPENIYSYEVVTVSE